MYVPEIYVKPSSSLSFNKLCIIMTYTNSYIGFPNATEFAALSELLRQIQVPLSPLLPDAKGESSFNGLLENDVSVQLPLHISLSRSLSLKTHERSDFQSALESSLKQSALLPFNLSLTDLKWVPNYDGNRWFLVLGIARPTCDEDAPSAHRSRYPEESGARFPSRYREPAFPAIQRAPDSPANTQANQIRAW